MHTRVKHVPTLTNTSVQKKRVDQVRKAASSEQQFLADLQIDAKTLDDWYTAPVQYTQQLIHTSSACTLPIFVDFSMGLIHILCVFWFYVYIVCLLVLRIKRSMFS